MNSRWLRVAAALLLAASCGPAAAQRPDPIPQVAGPILGPIVTEHRVTIGGRQIPYRAVFREYALKSEQGTALATISGTAYLRSDVRRSADRPVFFFFNGGPGASSSPLHFSAFGPKLRPEGRNADAPFVENAVSPLDATDLVFIDPVGTGFSRVLPGGDGRPYWGPIGDAAAVTSYIRQWLEENGRTGSPVFIGGESYGGFRLATMMQGAADLNLKGLLLISPATSMAGLAGAPRSDLDRVFTLPVMAIAAWHHEAVPRRAATAEQHHAEALAFAESEYLMALHKGPDLPVAEQRRVAERMAQLIGLPADLILQNKLRIGDDLFVEALLKSRNQMVGRLDTRVTAPVGPPAREGRPSAANDPSLGLGRTNVIGSAAISRYLREDLKVPVDRDYVSLTLDVNFSFNWFEPVEDRRLYYNPLPNVARVMAAKPEVRLMVAGGIYDLVTPTSSARHAIRHSAIPLDRVVFLTLPAGHSPFEEAPNRARFAAELRKFVGAGNR